MCWNAGPKHGSLKPTCLRDVNKTHGLKIAITFIICLWGAVVVAAPQTKQGSPIAVYADTLENLAVFVQYKAPAVVIALNNSKINAEVNAKIVDIPVYVGQVVQKNAIITRLNCRDYELTKRQKKTVAKSLVAKVDFAKYQLQRAAKLSQQQAVAEELLKQRETDLLVLQAQQEGNEVLLKQAQYNVRKCIVRAPFKAAVMERLGQVGELASAGTPLVRLLDIENIEVSAKLQAHQIASLEKIEAPRFVSRKNEYSLKLRAITPSIETRERTQDVRLTFRDKRALPGEAGELIWSINKPHIPADFLVRRHGKIGVFIVNSDIVKFLPIDGAVEGRPAPTVLANDQLIVTKGRFRLHDGDKVIIN